MDMKVNCELQNELLEIFLNLVSTNKLVTQQVYVQILPTTDQLMQKYSTKSSKLGPLLTN